MTLVALATTALALSAEPSAPRTSTEVRVRISEVGSCILTGASFNCSSLAAQLSSAQVGLNTRILLNPDVRANVQAVEAALSSLKKGGFLNVTFAARTRAESGGT